MSPLITRLVRKFSSKRNSTSLFQDSHPERIRTEPLHQSDQTPTEHVVQPWLKNTRLSKIDCPLLPPELLEEIFDIALETSFDFTNKRGHSRHRLGSPVRTTPFVLGSVCVYWRSVMFSTPRLWSHISIHFGPPKGVTMPKKQMAMLTKWIDRANEHPLTISLTLEDEWNRMWENNIPLELLKFLAETSHRWFSVNLVLAEAWYPVFSHLILAVTQRNKPHFPRLQKLKIQPRWSDLHVQPSRRRRLVFFQSINAPLLEDVDLKDYYLTDVDIPWHQLTALTIHAMTAGNDCLHALRRTSNLRYLYLSNISIITEDPPPRLHHLEHLVIQSSGWLDTQNLLNFAAPMHALTALEIISPLDQLDFIAIPPMLNSLNCRLRKLKLSEFIFIHHEALIIDSIREIDSLENLEINTKPSSQAVSRLFLALLAVRTQELDTYYLPRLQHFRFSGRIQHLEDGFDEALFQALQFRRGTAATEHMLTPLLSFYIRGIPIDHYDHYRIRSPGLEEKLEGLVRGGLKLDVVFGWTPWLQGNSTLYGKHRV